MPKKKPKIKTSNPQLRQELAKIHEAVTEAYRTKTKKSKVKIEVNVNIKTQPLSAKDMEELGKTLTWPEVFIGQLTLVNTISDTNIKKFTKYLSKMEFHQGSMLDFSDTQADKTKLISALSRSKPHQIDRLMLDGGRPLDLYSGIFTTALSNTKIGLLSINNVKVTDKSLLAFLTRLDNVTIERLFLINTGINDDCMKKLIKLCMTKLETQALTLSFNNITDAGIENSFSTKSVTAKTNHLAEINLSNNKVSEKGFSYIQKRVPGIRVVKTNFYERQPELEQKQHAESIVTSTVSTTRDLAKRIDESLRKYINNYANKDDAAYMEKVLGSGGSLGECTPKRGYFYRKESDAPLPIAGLERLPQADAARFLPMYKRAHEIGLKIPDAIMNRLIEKDMLPPPMSEMTTAPVAKSKRAADSSVSSRVSKQEKMLALIHKGSALKESDLLEFDAASRKLISQRAEEWEKEQAKIDAMYAAKGIKRGKKLVIKPSAPKSNKFGAVTSLGRVVANTRTLSDAVKKQLITFLEDSSKDNEMMKIMTVAIVSNKLDFSSSVVDAICRAIAGDETFTDLNMTGHIFSEVDAYGIAYFIPSITKLYENNFSTINLSRCNLGNNKEVREILFNPIAEADDLGFGLTSGETGLQSLKVSELNLSYNRISDDSSDIIEKAIFNMGVEHLDLSYNPCTAAIFTASMLRRLATSNLKSIDITGTRITSVPRQLAKYVKSSSASLSMPVSSPKPTATKHSFFEPTVDYEDSAYGDYSFGDFGSSGHQRKKDF